MGGSNTKVDISYKDGRLRKIITNANGSQEIITTTAKEIDRIRLTNDEWKEIERQGSKEFDYCIIENYNSLNECAGLFTDNMNDYAFVLDKYRLVHGSTCYSVNFRPGLCMNKDQADSAVNRLGLIVSQGKKCKIVYQDYNYNNEDMQRCCLTDVKSSCNSNLINDYTTVHCNPIMIEKCASDMNNPKCIRWLEQTYKRFEDQALELYGNWCENNFDNPTCDYFCNIARKNGDYRSVYCDEALRKWCSNNKTHKKCNCLYTPNDLIPNIEKYLGPKECWLSECSSEANSKWLTTDQLNTRKNCAVTNCIINIDKLTLNDDATAEFINNCVSGIDSSSTTSLNKNITKNIKYERKQDIVFIPELLLGSMLLLLLQFIKH